MASASADRCCGQRSHNAWSTYVAGLALGDHPEHRSEHPGRLCPVSTYTSFSSDGHTARWLTWDGEHDETFTLLWENEGWTASGIVGREQVQYVLRLSPTWHVRQFLLFRDLDEPDLWLGDRRRRPLGRDERRAPRSSSTGASTSSLDITPFTATIPIRRLPLHVGHTADITTLRIDVETLDVQPDHQRYTRLDTHRWATTRLETGDVTEFDVDEHGLVLDQPGRFRRSL